MDDNSSVSSGEISDAVAEMSTDDNLTTGSSLSAASFDRLHSNKCWFPLTLRDTSNELTSRSCGITLSSHCQQASSKDNRTARENWKKYTILSSNQTAVPMVCQVVARGSSQAATCATAKHSNKATVADIKYRPNKVEKCGTAVAVDSFQATDIVQNITPAYCNAKDSKDCESYSEKSTLQLMSHFYPAKEGQNGMGRSVNNGVLKSANNISSSDMQMSQRHQKTESRQDMCRARGMANETVSCKSTGCATDILEVGDEAKSNNHTNPRPENLEYVNKYYVDHQQSLSMIGTLGNAGKCFDGCMLA